MAGTAGDVRLNEILAALSLACDVGNDFPIEKGLRNTLLAVRLASELGVRGEALSAVYYVGLLRFIGCSGYADETSKIFPDDNAMRGAMAPVDFGYPAEGLRQAATLGRGALGRTRAVATMAGTRQAAWRGAPTGRLRGDDPRRAAARAASGRRDGARRRLRKMGRPRWPTRRPRRRDCDAGPRPRGRAPGRDSLPYRWADGRARDDSARCGWLVRSGDSRRGSSSTPIACSRRLPHRQCGMRSSTRSRPRTSSVAASRLPDVARLYGELADLKCAYTLGHSTGVADLAAGAAARLALTDADVDVIRTAGLLHDIGRLSVPTGIWNKPGPLSPAEWDRVRLHTYYTDRTLSQSPLLAPAGRRCVPAPRAPRRVRVPSRRACLHAVDAGADSGGRRRVPGADRTSTAPLRVR